MHRGAASPTLRIALAVVCVASFVRTASADDSGIPQKLLDHEAKVRAAFTPAQKSREAALEARLSPKMSVRDVTFLAQGATQGEMFAVMMQYLKLVQKEVKADRKGADSSARQSFSAKARKAAQDNAKLDASMQEAKEKARSLMDAATTGLATGVAGGAAQAGPALPPQGPAAPGPAPFGPTGATARVTDSVAAQRGIVVPTRTPTKASSSAAPASAGKP